MPGQAARWGGAGRREVPLVDIETVITEFEAALSQQIALAGDDPGVQAAGDAILAALYPAGRQLVLAVAEQAAEEVAAQLPDHQVDVVLSEGEPSLRMRSVEEPSAPFAPSDLEARLTLRLPQALKDAVEDAATTSGDSVNAYVVKTLGSKASKRDRRSGRRVQGTIQT